MPRVTALRERPRDHVLVALDGEAWRELPADAVVRAGLSVGRELDRSYLRLLRRELRRSEALAIARRALRSRDLSVCKVEERLARAGVPPSARAEALGALREGGLLDDERFAAATAQALAGRGWGDAAIALRLEQLGVGEAPTQAATAGLERESERARALLERRGRTPATARWLARRGFADEVVEEAFESLVADRSGARYDLRASSDIFPA